MLPGTTFSDPSAQTGQPGQPERCKPYTSNNFDMGGEWYTGGAGYVGVALFQKVLNGFTVHGTNTIPFSRWACLRPADQPAAAGHHQPRRPQHRHGHGQPAGQRRRHPDHPRLGTELGAAAGLPDEGHGLHGQLHPRRTRPATARGAPAVAVGVSPWTYNLTGYYEDHGAIRLSYNYNDAQVSSGQPEQRSVRHA
jgi:hypothetical protein